MDSFEYDVFLSFARADEPLVRPVWEHLSASGLRVFWSEASLQERLGDSWFEAIERSLERSRHFLIVCTPASIASKWVQREYRAFHSHCYRPGHRRLIPLLARGFDPAQLPIFAREIEACPLDGADSLRVVARMLGGADLESSRARLAVLEEENSILRATVDRLTGEVERLRAPAPADAPREPRPLDQRPERAPSRDADGRPPAPSEDERVDPPAPAPALEDSVLKAVRGWIDEIKVELPSLSDNNSPVKDQNSRDVFGILQWALPGIGKGEVIAALQALLRDSDRKVRWSAMRLLTYYRFSDAEALREYWKRENRTVGRELVLQSVSFLPEAEALDLVVDIACQDKSPRLRRQAVGVLPAYTSQAVRSRVMGVLMLALEDGNAGIREQALNTLAELKATESIAAASRMGVKDPNQTVRMAALTLVAEVAPIESFGLVLAALPDGNGTASSKALLGLVDRFTKRFGHNAMLAYVASVADPRRAWIETEIRKAGGGKV